MKYLLSVDGGGTKTIFSLSDLEGDQIGDSLAGSSNYKSVGINEAGKNLCEGFQKLKDKYKFSDSDIAYSVWGISGYDSEEDFRIILKLIRNTGLGNDQILLCNDGLLAYYAQAVEPGVVIIAGTGSIVLGVSTDGRSYRCGGWGYNFSDIGSGYWIGTEALKNTLLYCDGCEPYCPLYDGVRRFFGAEEFKSLPRIITGVTNYIEVAKVARVVVELSGEGEKKSTEILKEGAATLAKMTINIYRKLGILPNERSSIVFSGGVLTNQIYQTILRDSVLKELDKQDINLKRNVEFTMQKNEPVSGGIRLAQLAWKRR